jgi:hypothetical protein
MRVIEDGTKATDNQLLAISFAYFERLLSSSAPPLALKQLIEAIPSVTEERKDSPTFPFVSRARRIPHNLAAILQALQINAANVEGAHLKQYLESHNQPIIV